jgi:DNA-binding protein
VDASSDLVFTNSCRLVRDRKATDTASEAKNIPSIKVSWDQKLSTYIYRAKRLLAGAERVSISGIGLAITSVVLCAEILRDSGFVDIVSMETSMLHSKAQGATAHQKPVLEIVVERTPRFPELIEAENTARAARRAERERRGTGNATSGRRRFNSRAASGATAGAQENESENDVADEDDVEHEAADHDHH